MDKDKARSAVMGAISMALKAPILQQGFEIICKNLAELEKENAELKKACDETQELLDKQIEATYKLDKENAELDCQKNRNKFCYSCANATEKCIKNEIGCPCDKYKSYKEELNKWKDEWQEQVQKATDEGYARTLQTMQLTKAKEVMNIAIEGIKCWGIVGGTERPFEKQAEKLFNLFLDKAEQFLSEVKK